MEHGTPDLRSIEDGVATVIPIRALTDSENLSHSIRRDAGVVQDKRLRIVIAMLRQTVHEMTMKGRPQVQVDWVPTYMMLADCLTKLMDRSMFRAFLTATAFTATAPSSRPKKAIAGALAVLAQARPAAATETSPAPVRLDSVTDLLFARVDVPVWMLLALLTLAIVGLGFACVFRFDRRRAAVVHVSVQTDPELPEPDPEHSEPTSAPSTVLRFPSSRAPERQNTSPDRPAPKAQPAGAPTPEAPTATTAVPGAALRPVPPTRRRDRRPNCPVCGRPMVLKPANAGGMLWGCTQWPRCNGSRRPHDLG